MATASLAARLRAGETLISAWSAIPEPLVAEAIARLGFDCVTLDMQHGLHDTRSIQQSIGSVTAAGKPAVVRVPISDNAFASRALDMGAQAVIAPMINSVADARAFVAAMKYPPIGERSWGPNRAMVLSGKAPAAQLSTSNAETFAFAMIETVEALAALEDILVVAGVDGVFIGPSDLSVTLSRGARIAPDADDLGPVIRRISQAAEATGKVAGAYVPNPRRAKVCRDLGCRFLALGSDQAYLAAGATAMLDALR
ncbi:MAG TPA: aldolase/citrate lyase family protein [Bauldia sp.]|jgi:4-hydroxy-2-oxoheptanedioate aldolase